MGEQYKLTLPTVDDFAQLLANFGPGTLMWGLDLRRAYRQIRIDPLDWPLTCITWGDFHYANISVAFGIRHGAAFAQRLSQAVCDILGAESIKSLSYIDDFIGANPSLELANQAYARSISLCEELGLDLNTEKSVSPTTQITWIGVVYNTVNMSMRIPPQVIADTLELVQGWLVKQTATRHDLQVLLGKLFYAGKCCHAARLFVARMLDTLRSATPTGSVPLTQSFRADLHWWSSMLPAFNGRLLIQLHRPTYHLYLDIHPPHVTIHTLADTATAPLPQHVATNNQGSHCNCFAVLVALKLWGHLWSEGELLICSPQPQNLQVLVHGRSRDESILATARDIWLFTARWDIRLTPVPLGEFPIYARSTDSALVTQSI
jgi:hypothetical protein